MTQAHRRMWLAAPLCLWVLASLGCQQTHWAASSDTVSARTSEPQPRPASLVFESSRLRRLESEQAQAGEQPWYASRNEQRLTVVSGVQTPTFEHTDTRTYDRQYQSSGRVYDYYNQTTWRHRGKSGAH